MPYASGSPENRCMASWMGGESVAEGETILTQAGIPSFPYPDAAGEAFVAMWKHA